MKRPIYTVTFILLGCSLLISQSLKTAENPRPSFSIMITAPQDSVKVGSDMPLDIKLTNISAGDISASEILGGAALNYDIDVRDEDGRLGHETSIGRKLHGKDPTFPGLHGSIKSHTIKPGEVQRTVALLNKVYDLQPGNYTVNVSRHDAASGLLVKSNTITITVTP